MESRIIEVVGRRKTRSRERNCSLVSRNSLSPQLGHRTVQVRYYTDDGRCVRLCDEARSTVRRNAVPTASGHRLTLDVYQTPSSNESESMRGTVTTVFPIADEFGFPSGIGVSISGAVHVPGRSMMQCLLEERLV